MASSDTLREQVRDAIRDPILLFIEREFGMIATVESDRLADLLADAVVARLDGEAVSDDGKYEAPNLGSVIEHIGGGAYSSGELQRLADAIYQQAWRVVTWGAAVSDGQSMAGRADDDARPIWQPVQAWRRGRMMIMRLADLDGHQLERPYLVLELMGAAWEWVDDADTLRRASYLADQRTTPDAEAGGVA